MADDARPLDTDLLDGPGYREKRFSVDDLFELGELGLFNDANRYELWDGRIVMTPPAGAHHARSEARIVARFVLALSERGLLETRYVAQPNAGLEMTDDTFLQPDFAVLSPVDPDETPRLKPEHVHLCVEVSRSTLRDDLTIKRKKYAAAQIGEYWVIDTIARKLHCFRAPARGEYGEHTEIQPGESLSPLFEPAITIDVADLF